MTTFEQGQWVRLPRTLGYAEGYIRLVSLAANMCKVVIPGAGELTCDTDKLTPIEGPSVPDDAPQKNPDASEHPTIERRPAEVDLVVTYIRNIETGIDVCWCPWTPMMVSGRMGRLRTGEHPQCPAHTKEGYLFSFIDHVRQAFSGKKLIEGKGTGALKDWLEQKGALIEEYTTEEGKASVRWVE